MSIAPSPYIVLASVLSQTNSAAGDRFKFTGREFDALFGDYNYRCGRFTIAISGRFNRHRPRWAYAGLADPYRT